VHDLEDGIVTGYLQPATWQTDGFLEVLHRSVRSAPIKWQEGPPAQEEIAAYVKPLYDRFASGAPDVPMDVLRETTRHCIDKFVGAVDVRVDDDVTTSFDFRLDIPEEIRVENQVLKSITFEYILRDPRTVQIFHKGEKIVGRLYKGSTPTRWPNSGRTAFSSFPAGFAATSRLIGTTPARSRASSPTTSPR